MEEKTEGVKQKNGRKGEFITEQEGSQVAQQQYSDQDSDGTGSANCDQEEELDFYSHVATICESSLFSGLIMLINIMDAVLIYLETVFHLKFELYVFFAMAEGVFLAIYTMEFLMKLYVDPQKYIKTWSNVFDAVLLCVSYLSVFSGAEEFVADGFVNVIPQLRSMRLLRVVFLFPPLQFLTEVMTMKVVHVICLMLVLMFIFAISGFYFFGGPNSADPKRWGSMGSTFLTIFNLVIVDGWTDMQRALENTGTSSRFFIIVFIILAVFIILNMFTAVICEEVICASQKAERRLKMERERSLALKKQAMMLKQREEIRQLRQACRGNAGDFQQRVQQFKKRCLPTDKVVMEKPCASMTFTDLYRHTLHFQDDAMNKMSQHLDELIVLLELKDEDQLHEQEKR